LIFDITFGSAKKFRNALLTWDQKLLVDLINQGALNKKGADVYIKKDEATTLLCSAFKSSLPSHNLMAILELLISKRANVNAIDSNGRTPLHEACNTIFTEIKAIELLISKGANVNAIDSNGRTPLHEAFNKIIALETIELLISKGANVNAIDSNGRTPLHEAFNKIAERKTIIKLLISKGANVNAIDSNGRTPLSEASKSFNIDYCDRTSALHVIELLLSNGANVDTRFSGGTLLHEMCLKYSSREEQTSISIIELLLSKGADVNAIDILRRTPLHLVCDFFCYRNNINTLELLLSKGADVNAIDSGGKTPLHYACTNSRDERSIELHFSNRSNVNAIELLLSKGADVNAIDSNGRTPLHQACQDWTSRQIELLLSKGADVNAIDSKGNTPLSTVVKRNCSPFYLSLMVDILLKKGANKNLLDATLHSSLLKLESLQSKKIKEIDKSIGNFSCNNSKNTVPENKYEPQYRASDGHMVRSRAELVIDNWLYTNRIFHEYEKYLPTTERVLSDFYLPEQDIYIEFWGLENDSQYNARKKEKLKIYHKYQFRLLELHDSDLLNLEDSLASKLRGFANNKLRKRLNISDRETDDARQVALKQKPLHKRINLDTDDDIPF